MIIYRLFLAVFNPDSLDPMRAPQVSGERQPVLPDIVFMIIGYYVNCPIAYFALRRSCRSLYGILVGTCPVSLETLVAIVEPIPYWKLTLDRLSLRLVSSHRLAYVLNALRDSSRDQETWAQFFLQLVREAPRDQLAELPDDELGLCFRPRWRLICRQTARKRLPSCVSRRV